MLGRSSVPNVKLPLEGIYTTRMLTYIWFVLVVATDDESPLPLSQLTTGCITFLFSSVDPSICSYCSCLLHKHVLILACSVSCSIYSLRLFSFLQLSINTCQFCMWLHMFSTVVLLHTNMIYKLPIVPAPQCFLHNCYISYHLALLLAWRSIALICSLPIFSFLICSLPIFSFFTLSCFNS